jgi:hypothetical protein
LLTKAGPIEKGANDGQVQYAKDLAAALKLALNFRARAGTGLTTGKGKKKGRKDRALKSLPNSTNGSSASKSAPVSDWGLLEPLHGPLGPLVDILQPLLTGNILYGLLVGLLVASWFRYGGRGGGKGEMGFYGTPERIAAYEEIWRREESELWDWLEERVGLDRLMEERRTKFVEDRGTEAKLREERMGEREVDEAIRITEEKLSALKGVVEKRKGRDSRSSAQEGGSENKLDVD